MLRIRYSRPRTSRNPPEVFDEYERSAASSASSVTPRSAIRLGSGWTWNCRTSPPIGMTCATPGIDIRRGRSTQSANSRTAIGSIFEGSTGMAIIMISPMIDETGPIRGSTPGGIPASSAPRRSDTIWRARQMSVSQPKDT